MTAFLCHKRLWLALVLLNLLAAGTNLRAQKLYEWDKLWLRPIAEHSCLRDSSHRQLIYPAGRSEAIMGVYDILEAMLTGDNQAQLNIFHIGGSHVQAGWLSHRLRTNLTHAQAEFTDDNRDLQGLAAYRGLLFPYRAIRTNSPQDYRINYTGRWTASRCVAQMPDVQLGLSGAAAITADSAASLTVNLRQEGKWNFKTLQVLGDASDVSVYPIVITQNGDTLESQQRLVLKPHNKFFFLADGLDMPGWYFILPQEDSCCTVAFRGLSTVLPEPVAKPAKGKKKPAKPAPNYQPLDSTHYFILRGLIPSGNRRGITYTASGINGAAVPSWLRCSEMLFTSELSMMPPHLAIFGIGINDANVPQADFDTAAFKAGYREIIDRIHSVNPHCALLFITNNDCWLNSGRQRRIPNPNTSRARDAFMALAKEYQGAVFDVYDLMGGFRSSDKWVKAGLMQRDHIHFTQEGYHLIADLLYNALILDYQQSRETKSE